MKRKTTMLFAVIALFIITAVAQAAGEHPFPSGSGVGQAELCFIYKIEYYPPVEKLYDPYVNDAFSAN